MNIEERIDFYKKTRMFENEIVRISENTVRNLDGTIYHGLITAIARDSKKHAYLLDTLVKVLTEQQPQLDDTKFLEIQDDIKEHIELEAEAIDKYKRILDDKDPLISEEEKSVIKFIHEDEIKHHRVLKKILELLQKRID